jgi:hypothetical protein
MGSMAEGMDATKAVPKLITAKTPIQILQSFLMTFQSVRVDVVDATLDTILLAFFVTLFAARCHVMICSCRNIYNICK